MRLKESEVAGVLLVAADNASEARVAAAEVQAHAQRQDRSIAQQAQQLFAALAPPAAHPAPAGSRPPATPEQGDRS